jgi:hypothetical protein
VDDRAVCRAERAQQGCDGYQRVDGAGDRERTVVEEVALHVDRDQRGVVEMRLGVTVGHRL